MINIKEFLLKNNINFTYALITYDNKTEPTWFTKYNFGDGDWFLESPCELYKVMDITEPIDDFSKRYVEELYDLEDGETVENFANKHIKTMIVNKTLYKIENFQCSPYLPIMVDRIKLINEKECLEYMLNQMEMVK